MSHDKHFIHIPRQLTVFAVFTALSSSILAQPPNFVGPPGWEPTDVNVVNRVEVEGNVRVEPRTRSYTLRISSLSNVAFENVPFDSYITGVLFTAIGSSSSISAPPCTTLFSYNQSNTRPGGSNTNLIARVQLHGVGSEWGSTEYIPIPNMFVGQDVLLEILYDNPANCSVEALVYLIPATTGITPPGGGIGLSNP
jgi:hypothetical protein